MTGKPLTLTGTYPFTTNGDPPLTLTGTYPFTTNGDPPLTLTGTYPFTLSLSKGHSAACTNSNFPLWTV